MYVIKNDTKAPIRIPYSKIGVSVISRWSQYIRLNNTDFLQYLYHFRNDFLQSLLNNGISKKYIKWG